MSYPWDAQDLWRVEDPNTPGALAVSATGAVVAGEPVGIPHAHEPVPEPTDALSAIEGVAAMGADGWHARGVTGAGVRVAVLDVQWFGAEADPDALGEVATHDCWFAASCDAPMDTSRARFGFEEGVHGVGCAEVVRGVAPDVELHLVRTNGMTTLENAFDWAIREDIDVLSLSIAYFNASFYDGTGPVNQLVERLRAADVLLVAAAGNYARGHWDGAFTDGDGDGRMDFDGANGLWLALSGGGPYVSWDQFHACGTTDLDAVLYDANGAIVSRGEAVQDPDGDACSPFERLGAVPEDGWYFLEVRDVRGPTVGLRVNVLATGGRIDGGDPSGSVTDPGTAEEALTVGAVRADGYLQNGSEGFSSQGPTSDGRAKPDLAGPDGLTVGAYGAEGFFGTSAATPAVAGAVALVMSEDPSLGPYEAADRLRGWAWSDGPGFDADPAIGAGRVRLPPAETPSPCGHRPLVMPLLLVPWFGRRARRLH